MSFHDFTANLKEMNITGAKAAEMDAPEPTVRATSYAHPPEYAVTLARLPATYNV